MNNIGTVRVLPAYVKAMNAWEQTLTEMQSRAAALRSDGWTVVTVPAATTTPEPSSVGTTDRFGLVYVAPDDVEESFREAFEHGEFTECEVFRQTVGETLFLLTIVRDADAEIAIILAGGVDTTDMGPLTEDARETNEMYSHVQLLDWTHLGTFHHDDPELLLPERRKSRRTEE